MASGALVTGSALRQAVRAGDSATGAKAPTQGKRDITWQCGDRIVHRTFGPGTIESITGDPDDQTIIIDFERDGPKELLLNYAKACLKRAR